MDIQADIPDSALEAKTLTGNLSCEPPNSDLHNFLGNFAYRPKGSQAFLQYLGRSALTEACGMMRAASYRTPSRIRASLADDFSHGCASKPPQQGCMAAGHWKYVG